jgi:hypothetical protein
MTTQALISDEPETPTIEAVSESPVITGTRFTISEKTRDRIVIVVGLVAVAALVAMTWYLGTD